MGGIQGGVDQKLSRFLGIEHDPRATLGPMRERVAQKRAHPAVHTLHGLCRLVDGLCSQGELCPLGVQLHAHLDDLLLIVGIGERLESVDADLLKQAQVHGEQGIGFRCEVRPRQEQLSEEGREHVRLPFKDHLGCEQLEVCAPHGSTDDTIEALLWIFGEFHDLGRDNRQQQTDGLPVLQVGAEILHRPMEHRGQLHVRPAEQQLLGGGCGERLEVFTAVQQGRRVVRWLPSCRSRVPLQLFEQIIDQLGVRQHLLLGRSLL
mmetsp:Transcript_25326/g.84584  ORF Transcript_25326/g.84584 Transcript_25326/m.84584 type:complete len:263 (-) Transcript_25326:1535-2323(-)